MSAVLLAVILLSLYYGFEKRNPLVYQEHLEDVAVTVDGTKLTMQDLAFYILYEEGRVEQQAMVYNADNTRDYWNLHVDGVFIRESTKTAIMDMAIHDQLFYQFAKERHIALTRNEQKYADNMMADFWMDLLDGQQQKMGVSDEYINASMQKMALAQKYQRKLAEENQQSYASYNWDGYSYKQLLETRDVKINERLWNRVTVGDISLVHDRVNYINGYDKKED